MPHVNAVAAFFRAFSRRVPFERVGRVVRASPLSCAYSRLVTATTLVLISRMGACCISIRLRTPAYTHPLTFCSPETLNDEGCSAYSKDEKDKDVRDESKKP